MHEISICTYRPSCLPTPTIPHRGGMGVSSLTFFLGIASNAKNWIENPCLTAPTEHAVGSDEDKCTEKMLFARNWIKFPDLYRKVKLTNDSIPWGGANIKKASRLWPQQFYAYILGIWQMYLFSIINEHLSILCLAHILFSVFMAVTLGTVHTSVMAMKYSADSLKYFYIFNPLIIPCLAAIFALSCSWTLIDSLFGRHISIFHIYENII